MAGVVAEPDHAGQRCAQSHSDGVVVGAVREYWRDLDSLDHAHDRAVSGDVVYAYCGGGDDVQQPDIDAELD